MKPSMDGTISKTDYEKTIFFFEELVALLHPFMPFVTEEIYHQLRNRKEGDVLCVKQIVQALAIDNTILKQAELLKEMITAIREVRVKNNIKQKQSIKLHIEATEKQSLNGVEDILKKQTNAEALDFVSAPVSDCLNIVVDKLKLYVQTEQPLDTSNQKADLQKELDYLKGFLISVEKKLGNERFVQNAKPEVVEAERKKKADAEQKMKAIEESLAALG
jgi:valyl-tRNA synthetase